MVLSLQTNQEVRPPLSPSVGGLFWASNEACFSTGWLGQRDCIMRHACGGTGRGIHCQICCWGNSVGFVSSKYRAADSAGSFETVALCSLRVNGLDSPNVPIPSYSCINGYI